MTGRATLAARPLSLLLVLTWLLTACSGGATPTTSSTPTVSSTPAASGQPTTAPATARPATPASGPTVAAAATTAPTNGPLVVTAVPAATGSAGPTPAAAAVAATPAATVAAGSTPAIAATAGQPQAASTAAPAATAGAEAASTAAPAAAGASGIGFSVQVFLWGNPDTTDRDLRLAKRAGFSWVKQRFEWRYIEPNRRGKYDWAEADRVVNAVSAQGLKLIARMDNQPKWAREDNLFPESGPPSDLEDWKDFLQEFSERYKGKIGAYQIWNEPNLAREWGGAKPDAAQYVAMLQVSHEAIKGPDPDALIVSAGLSPTTDDSAQARPDLLYLRDMYAAGLKGTVDMVGVHAAGFKAEPEADPGEVAKDPELTNHDPSSEELKRSYAFRHVEDMRQVMLDNGDADTPMAVLETGWTSDTRPGSPYAWFGVSEEQKADYIARAITYAKEHWPYVRLFNLIYLPQPNWTKADEQYYWSLTDPDGTPRPAYHAVQDVLNGP